MKSPLFWYTESFVMMHNIGVKFSSLKTSQDKNWVLHNHTIKLMPI